MTKSENTWKYLFSGSNSLKTSALCGGVALHAINVFLATTILPSIIDDIGGMQFYTWNTSLFIIASIIGSVLSPRLLASGGSKSAYLTSIIIFSMGTLLCTLAPSMTIMLAGRFVQGLGGGLLFSLSYAMVRIIFEEHLWPRAMALISGMWGIAALSGPFIGGVFAQFGIWRFAFGSILCISAILFILVFKIFPRKEDMQIYKNEPSPVPIVKLGVLTIAIIFVSIGSITSNLLINVLGVLFAILLILLLVRLEKKSANRILPRGSYIISSDIGSTFGAMTFLAFATSIEIFIPYYFQEIHDYSPLKAGYLTIIIALGWTGSSLLFSGATSKKLKRVLQVGPIIMSLGLLSLSFLIPAAFSSTLFGLILTCFSLALIGAGIGMGWPHLLARVLSSAEKGDEDQASSAITTVQLMATAFGASFTGIVTNLAGINDPGGVSGAQSSAFWLFIIFALAPAFSLLIIRKYITKS